MSIGKYFLVLFLCTLFCWFSWLGVVFYIDPTESGILGLVFFYLTLALALIGTFSLCGFFIRIVFKKDDPAYRYINIASRQSIIFTLLIICTLILQSFRYLLWWNLLLLIVIAVLIELFLISYKKLNK